MFVHEKLPWPAPLQQTHKFSFSIVKLMTSKWALSARSFRAR